MKFLSRAARLLRPILASATAAWVLAACSSPSDTADPVPASDAVTASSPTAPAASSAAPETAAPIAQETSLPLAAPKAFVFESGVLEFGQIDPLELGDDLFDPCNDITPEEFAQAGYPEFEPVDPLMEAYASEVSFCQLPATESETRDAMGKIFSSGDANRELLEAAGRVRNQFHSEKVPELFVFGPEFDDPGLCYAQIDTVRGPIVAGVSALTDMDRTCPEAILMLENLYAAHGNS